MKWAADIVDNRIKRQEIDASLRDEYIKSIVEEVTNYAVNNIARWQNEKSKSNCTLEHEMARLIDLWQERDEVAQFEYEWMLKGYEVRAGHRRPPRIQYVKLNFTNEEWADFLNKEGEYLPICCGSISRIRDILQDALREDGEINVEYLAEMVGLMKGHGDFGPENPLNKIYDLWDTIREDSCFKKDSIYSSTLPNDQTAADAIKSLCRAANIIDFADFGDSELSLGQLAHRQSELALLMNAVHVLYHKGLNLSKADVVEGYALYEDGQIASTRVGLAVYSSIEELKEINSRVFIMDGIDDWGGETTDEEVAERKKRYSIKKVRITIQRGLEVLEECSG